LLGTGVADEIGIGLVGALNVNSAPFALLARAEPLDAEAAAAVLKARADFAIEGSDQLAAAVDRPGQLDPFAFAYAADAHVRARIGPVGAPPVIEVSVRAANGDAWPLWSLDYQMPTPQKARDDRGPETEREFSPVGADADRQWLHTRP